VPLPRPAPGTAKWWVISAVGISLGSIMAGWWGWSATADSPSGQTMGYRVLDDRTVDVTYVVNNLPIGRDVICVIHALDKGFGTVGTLEVHIPGSQTSSVQRTSRVRTTTRAVTGVVKSCSLR
jgi:Domain of unknown function (DUF4307)